MQTLLILGRQPLLGLAELESLHGGSVIKPIMHDPRISSSAALLDVPTDKIDFDRLGGALKCCKVLTILDTTDWREIESYLIKTTPIHAQYIESSSKLQLGLSAYGLNITTKQLMASGLSIKKVLRSSGRAVRLVPNTELALGSASVLHNHLTGPAGWELVLLRNGEQTILAQTTGVQDINSYTLRDRGRPKRDARVGMLPPKLAQIIINLAKPAPGSVILDPFCGTGVLLQEALLMGYGAYGADIDPRMVAYSQENLDWLQTQEIWPTDDDEEEHVDPHIFLEAQDAAQFVSHDQFDTVASEIYLGRPFTGPPSVQILAQTISEVNLILRKFLLAVHRQVPRGSRLCLAIPAWQVSPDQFKQLPLIDSLAAMGYNRVSFEHVRPEELLYYRPDQIVARELLVLETR